MGRKPLRNNPCRIDREKAQGNMYTGTPPLYLSPHKGMLTPLFLLMICLLLWSAFFPGECLSLKPHQILVLANHNAAHSVGLAKYYCRKRGIPEDHILKLWTTDKESCTREEYEKAIAVRVREYLKENDPLHGIQCIVIMFGLPLKIAPPALSPRKKEEIEGLKKRREALKGKTEKGDESKEDKQKIQHELNDIKEKIDTLQKLDQAAAVDSEIALILEEGHPLQGWMPNPYFLGFKGKTLPVKKENVLMVSRIDGPSYTIVERIIDDSVQTEKTGLRGTAYFDARWPEPKDKKVSGYAFYDQSIHAAAKGIKEIGLIRTVINSEQGLFQPGDCPDAALYCGWYSLAHYVDAFTWKPGSIGYHIASAECQTLKSASSQVWCKVMLEKGVAATIGPVGEPYVEAFPVPELFFKLLMDGALTLSECYILSTPYLSWMMVLVGDPLYTPFKHREKNQ